MCYTAGQLAQENLYRHETHKCKPHYRVCFSFFRVAEKYFFAFNFSWHLQWPSDSSLHGLLSLSCAYGRLFKHQQKFLQVRANSMVPKIWLKNVASIYFTPSFVSVFRYTAAIVCKTSTAVNPFIYFFMVDSFRQDFVEVLGMLCLGGEGAGYAAASDAKSKARTNSFVRYW